MSMPKQSSIFTIYFDLKAFCNLDSASFLVLGIGLVISHAQSHNVEILMGSESKRTKLRLVLSTIVAEMLASCSAVLSVPLIVLYF